MGELKIIFEMKESSLYKQIEAKDILSFEKEDMYTSIEGVKSRGFRLHSLPQFQTLRPFVSNNYQAFYGDFSNYEELVKLKEIFGPAHVLGMGLNTGDWHEREKRLKQLFFELEKLFPEARKKLSYIGVLYGSRNGLIYKDQEKDLVDRLFIE